MNDQQKTQQQLIDDLVQQRKRVADLEMQLASSQQAELHASEAKYRRLYQTMRDAFVSVDMNGHIQEYNDAYSQMLGYEPDELSALTYIDITPEKWHAFEAEIVRDQILPVGYSRTYEKEYRRKNGTVFPVELRTCLISGDDGKPCAMWAIVRDITERKQIEKERQQANERLEQRVEERTAELRDSNDQLRIFKTFAEASTQGFGMSDMDGKIVYGNAALARLVGEAKPEDAHGKHPSIYYSEDYHESQVAEIFPVLQRSGSWQGELTMVSATGEKIPVLQTSFTLVDQNGEPVRRGVVITDLREIRRAETSLQESLTELQAIYDGMIDGLVLVDLATR